jgi:hypothetical protein
LSQAAALAVEIGVRQTVKNAHYPPFLVFIAALVLAAVACGSSGSVAKQPTAPVAPITLGGDLTQIDVCRAIPQEDIEAVMGRRLAKTPEHFEYYDTTGSSGCWYEASKDSDGEAHFGYVAFTSIDAYNDQPLYLNVDVSGLGVAAYFNNGADARQLWVKINDTTAFVVAFGDVPREDGAKALAALILAAVK